MGTLRRLILVAVAALAAGCTFPAMATVTPEPSPTPSPTATPAPTPTPTSSPPPSVSPTPDAAAIPAFTAGDVVVTAIDGLRVRQRPNVSSVVVAGLLPMATELQVVMGPVLVEDLGWYLVTDADSDEPQFGEGWIASGFEPEPFLQPSGRQAEGSPFLASFALVGDADYGPIEIPDEHHAIRWLALDPARVRCQFSVDLTAADEDPVPAIRATIGTDVVPGTLQPSFFAAHPDLRGQVFLSVQSNCAWTLVVARVPEPLPDPSPSATDGA